MNPSICRGMFTKATFSNSYMLRLSAACKALGTFGQNMALQSYRGLLIGFNWPSYGSADNIIYNGNLPYSFPPTAESGTIRDNIHGITTSFKKGEPPAGVRRWRTTALLNSLQGASELSRA